MTDLSDPGYKELLRDKFAGDALKGMAIMSLGEAFNNADELAAAAYRIADAMLRRRRMDDE